MATRYQYVGIKKKNCMLPDALWASHGDALSLQYAGFRAPVCY